MIDVFLGRLLLKDGTPWLELDDHESSHVSFQDGVKLCTHANMPYREIYLSTSDLDSQLRALTVVVEDQQGVLAEISDFLGKEGIDIDQCGYFTIGASGVSESVFRHSTTPGVMATATQMAKIFEELGKLQYVRKVYPQSVNDIMPFLDTLQRCDGLSEVSKRQIKLTPSILEKLKLKDTKHLCIVTSYMRFPMIIIKILDDSRNIAFIGADLTHEPLVLGPFCDSIKDLVNIIGLSIDYIPAPSNGSPNRVRTRIFSRITGRNKSCEDVRAKLMGINDKHHRNLIDIKSVKVIPITEYERQAFKNPTGD